MNTRIPLIASALLAASIGSGTAQAALQGRDLNGSIDSFEAYYDTDLNITWLADANYAQTSGFDQSTWNWYTASTWVANLSFTNGANVYDNWRLPTTLQPDASCSGLSTPYGYNCTGSEMGHLFYLELGGTAHHSIVESTDPDLEKFTNIHQGYYWGSTEYTQYPTGVWGFNFFGGFQIAANKTDVYYPIWAVSDGDVGIAAIPEPESYAMMLAGLGLIAAMARRRKIAKG